MCYDNPCIDKYSSTSVNLINKIVRRGFWSSSRLFLSQWDQCSTQQEYHRQKHLSGDMSSWLFAAHGRHFHHCLTRITPKFTGMSCPRSSELYSHYPLRIMDMDWDEVTPVLKKCYVMSGLSQTIVLSVTRYEWEKCPLYYSLKRLCQWQRVFILSVVFWTYGHPV